MSNWFPGVDAKGDIRQIVSEGVDVWAKHVWDDVRETIADIVLFGCGFTCREITSVNKGRKGLDHGDTAW